MKFRNVLITAIAWCLFQLCEACLILKQAGSYETRKTWWRNLGIMEWSRKHWQNLIPVPNTPKKPEMVGQPHVGNTFRQTLLQTSCSMMRHRLHSPDFGKLQDSHGSTGLPASRFHKREFYKGSYEMIQQAKVVMAVRDDDQSSVPGPRLWEESDDSQKLSLDLHTYIGAHTRPLSCTWYDNQINVIIFKRK